MAEPTPLSELLGSTSVESVLGSDVLEPEERRPPAWAPREKLSPQEALQMRFRAGRGARRSACFSVARGR